MQAELRHARVVEFSTPGCTRQPVDGIDGRAWFILVVTIIMRRQWVALQTDCVPRGAMNGRPWRTIIAA